MGIGKLVTAIGYWLISDSSFGNESTKTAITPHNQLINKHIT